MSSLASIKDDETFGPLLVHDAVSTLATSDGVLWPDLILTKEIIVLKNDDV
jgi:hypothetical protein